MEYPQHKKAKFILKSILIHLGYVVKEEVSMPPIKTYLGERNYILDLLAIKDGKAICFELDGFRGHSTKRDFAKMNLRDKVLFQWYRIKTVRIRVRDLVGQKKIPLPIILKEIEWQLAPAKTTSASR